MSDRRGTAGFALRILATLQGTLSEESAGLALNLAIARSG
jgi:hypothetical protein